MFSVAAAAAAMSPHLLHELTREEVKRKSPKPDPIQNPKLFRSLQSWIFFVQKMTKKLDLQQKEITFFCSRNPTSMGSKKKAHIILSTEHRSSDDVVAKAKQHWGAAKHNG